MLLTKRFSRCGLGFLLAHKLRLTSGLFSLTLKPPSSRCLSFLLALKLCLTGGFTGGFTGLCLIPLALQLSCCRRLSLLLTLKLRLSSGLIPLALQIRSRLSSRCFRRRLLSSALPGPAIRPSGRPVVAILRRGR